MKCLIRKKSNKPFPPPFEGDGKTAVAIDIVENIYDPKRRKAFKLMNGSFINCEVVEIIEKYD